MNVRQLHESDRKVVEAFLANHRDSSMFLRQNIARAGFDYHGNFLEAEYHGAFDEGGLAGIVGHCWNGMLLVQAPRGLDLLAPHAIEQSRRRVTGTSGPAEQVRLAIDVLGLTDAPKLKAEDEGLYVLDLNDLVVPHPLALGDIECRPPRPDEYETLRTWRFDYDVEALGSAPTDATRQRSSRFLDAQIQEQNVWVAVSAARPVSLAAFNAALPDIVQLGGIYTPPEHRSHGFARAAVAASLLAARQRGVTRAVLFTANPFAVRSYEAVGFHRVGDYGLVILAA